jgi:hypothetical protein
VICKRDFLKEGISLKQLGIEDLDKEQIIRYIRGNSSATKALSHEGKT